MSFFNKINDVLIVDTFKQIFQRKDIDIEVFTLDALQLGALVLVSKYRNNSSANQIRSTLLLSPVSTTRVDGPS